MHPVRNSDDSCSPIVPRRSDRVSLECPSSTYVLALSFHSFDQHLLTRAGSVG